MNEARKVINDLLVKLFNRILIIEHEALRGAGIKLSMNEVHVLETIRDLDVPTMSQIAESLHITVGSATIAINTLQKKGFVRRRRDRHDRRRVIVGLTDDAVHVLKVHDDFHDEMISAVIRDFEIEDNDVLIDALRNLSEYFERIKKSG